MRRSKQHPEIRCGAKKVNKLIGGIHGHSDPGGRRCGRQEAATVQGLPVH